MGIKIMKAETADAKELAEVFNQSFYSDYVKYGECPGYGKTEHDMLFGMKKYVVYKILLDDKIVGAISVKQESENNLFLGALCVAPDYANKGIGQTAMGLLDNEFPAAEHWALETPADKSQNHYFYKKLGYKITKEYMDGGVKISYFEKN